MNKDRKSIGIIAAATGMLGLNREAPEMPSLDIQAAKEKERKAYQKAQPAPRRSFNFSRTYAQGHKPRYFTEEEVKLRQQRALERKNARRTINGLPPKATYAEI